MPAGSRVNYQRQKLPFMKVADATGSTIVGPLKVSALVPASPIDRLDIRFAVFVGMLTGGVKMIGRTMPAWEVRDNDALLAFLVCLVYIVARGQRQPAKLDEWGLTTPLTPGALVGGLALLLLGIALQAAAGLAAAGTLSFEIAYLPRMIDYIPGAFPQQFFMCSVGLVTLARFPIFHGLWRLPLTVGIVFSLAHWWTPARLPGTFIPIQMLTTLPAGFFCALYFLKFRTVLPLTLLHAILFVLGVEWVERHL